ncbi:MAG: Holliday junction resolvase RuvX [Candidatus Hydrogenedentes bacterium]|nr:Holliday junction resolvase RuvX [Candidatus Hydrogenedentota bacterium]
MDEQGRIVGLDVGDVRIGVAVSDPLGIVAQAREVVERRSPEEDVDAIRRIVGEYEAVCVVAGLPLNQEGRPGPQAEKVLAFIEMLEAVVGVPVETQDERFSTAAAERALIAANVRRKGRKKVIDKVAAQYILQTYLDRRANQRKRDSE